MITHTARHLIAAARLSLAGLGLAVLAAGCTVAPPSATTSDIAHDIPFRAGERLTYGIWGIDPDPIGYGTLSVEADGDVLVLKQAYRAADEPTATARDTNSQPMPAITGLPHAWNSPGKLTPPLVVVPPGNPVFSTSSVFAPARPA